MLETDAVEKINVDKMIKALNYFTAVPNHIPYIGDITLELTKGISTNIASMREFGVLSVLDACGNSRDDR